jgi:hypothetical protein
MPKTKTAKSKPAKKQAKNARASRSKPAASRKTAASASAPAGYNPVAAQRVKAILQRLDELYPGVTCALTHESPWELLVATILSAQCTDRSEERRVGKECR